MAAETEVPVLNTTRPRRHGKAPSYLLDYHCSLISMEKALSSHFVSNITTSFHSLDTYSPPRHPISSVLSYDNITPCFKNAILTCSLETAPTSFKQAIKSVIWTKAMNVEFQGMALNKTFSVVLLPSGKNIVGCRWIYTIKYNVDGSVERPKARLVAKGYTQLEGLDYTDTFSPVAKMTSVKLLLALAANHGWSISQMNVTNAILHSNFDEEIYMSLPLGYIPAPGEALPPNLVCKLHKSIYGLKQASRQGYNFFSSVLLADGFTPSRSDHSLFVKINETSFIPLLVYCDDCENRNSHYRFTFKLGN